jgi:hypothetical protein
MDQSLTTEFQNKTTVEKNSKFEKNLLFFIPQNTTVFTKEMVRQLAREQRVMRKELERYDSWFNTIKFQLIVAIGKLKFVRIFLK